MQTQGAECGSPESSPFTVGAGILMGMAAPCCSGGDGQFPCGTRLCLLSEDLTGSDLLLVTSTPRMSSAITVAPPENGCPKGEATERIVGDRRYRTRRLYLAGFACYFSRSVWVCITRFCLRTKVTKLLCKEGLLMTACQYDEKKPNLELENQGRAQ
jgi:hypothetical protein